MQGVSKSPHHKCAGVSPVITSGMGKYLKMYVSECVSSSVVTCSFNLFKKNYGSWIILSKGSYTSIVVCLAGSEILTTNTFQASVSGFQKHLKTDYDNSLNLIREGVYLARKAIENSVMEGQYSIMYCMIILCQVFV